MERRTAFSLPKYVNFLPLVGLVPLTLTAILSPVPILRFLAISLLAGSVAFLSLANLYLSLQITKLSDFVDDQAQTITKKQRYLIAAKIHETVTQLLFAASLITDAMLVNKADHSPEIVTSLQDLHQLTSTTHTAIRHLLLELRPTRINEVPLDRLITELVQIKRLSTEIEIQCMAIGTAYYPPGVHQSLYQIVDLALSNSVLHAQASYILVCLFLSQEEAIVSVEDDGCGFNPTQLKPEHFGLEDMSLCAHGIGASLVFDTLPGPRPKRVTCIWKRP